MLMLITFFAEILEISSGESKWGNLVIGFYSILVLFLGIIKILKFNISFLREKLLFLEFINTGGKT